MTKFALYCKSYRNDLFRAHILANSISKYNKDNIPFYISVPKQDVELFKTHIPNVTILQDEDILGHLNLSVKENWLTQQIIKSNFWRLGLAENYLCLDSDSQFIKDFFISDFMYDEDTPYTVCHEQKELWNWSVLHTRELGFDPKISFTEERLRIMNLFGRKGVPYDFGPSPTIWSAKVWKVLDEIMTMNNLNWSSIMQISCSEFTWYGETLLYSQTIPLHPREPLFKVFHYYQQYVEHKRAGVTLDHISQNYMGVILQSNWPTPVLNY